jgi:PAS domain S-box-containing protein
VDLKGNLTFFTQALAKAFGYSKAELMGLNNRQYTDDVNAKKMFQAFNQVYRDGMPMKGVRVETITKANTTRNLELSIALILGDSGQPIGFRGSARDITDLIQNQEALQKSEERYRTIIETMEEGYYENDLAGNLTFVNEAMARVLGYSRAEMLGMNNRQYVDAENSKILYRGFNQVYRTGNPIKGIQYEIVTRNGEKKYVETSPSLIRNQLGDPVGFRGISRDITDLVLIQNALKKSEERYRTIIETIEDAYYEVDLAGNFTFFNDAMVRILEYPRPEMLGMNNRQYTDAENAKKLFESFNRVYRTGEPSRGVIYEAITKNGERKTISTSVTLLTDPLGNPVGFRGISKDITDLIQTQKALQVSEERYRTMIETIADAYYELDLRGNLTFFNDAFVRTFKTPREDLVGLNYRRYTKPEDIDKVSQDFNRAYTTGEPIQDLRFDIITFPGESKTVTNSISLIRDRSGNPVGFRGISKDITELIQIQTALKESEERYRTIIETIEDGYYEVDLAGNLTYFNDVMVGIHEYSREELMGMNNRHYTDAENAKILFKAFNRVYSTGEPSKGTHYEIITKGDGRKNLEASVTLIKDSKDNPIGFRGIIRDVTQLKETQKALQTSEERFRIAAKSTNDFIYEWDLQSGQIDWSGTAGEKLAHILGELPTTAVDYEKRIHPEDHERFSKAVINHLRQVDPYHEEYRIIGKDGNIFHLSAAGMGIRNDKGWVNKWIGVISDITERKKAEEDLKQSFEKVRKALGGIIRAMALTVETKDPYTSGHQQRVSNLARTIAQEMKLSKDQIEAIRLTGVVHDLGKIAVPAEILSKPTRLSELEFSLIKGHPQTSYDILKDIDFPWPIAEIALQHHERLNGSGYPAGLVGEEIMIEAQVLMVADVVEAIASHRPYRPALGVQLALDEISKNRGILYNPAAVDACLKLFREKGFDFSQTAPAEISLLPLAGN